MGLDHNPLDHANWRAEHAAKQAAALRQSQANALMEYRQATSDFNRDLVNLGKIIPREVEALSELKQISSDVLKKFTVTVGLSNADLSASGNASDWCEAAVKAHDLIKDYLTSDNHREIDQRRMREASEALSRTGQNVKNAFNRLEALGVNPRSDTETTIQRGGSVKPDKRESVGSIDRSFASRADISRAGGSFNPSRDSSGRDTCWT